MNKIIQNRESALESAFIIRLDDPPNNPKKRKRFETKSRVKNRGIEDSFRKILD